MENKDNLIIFSLLLIIIFLFYLTYPNESSNPKEVILSNDSTIKISSWNLQIFGDTKASNEIIMEKYINKINNYDIIFIQEIRDIDGSSFNELCSSLNDYNCEISSRAGRSTSKEQYGLIYKKELKFISFLDYNPDAQDRWERPPMKAFFDMGNYNLTLINFHAKPSDVQIELSYLEDVSNGKNVIIIGDLNADCDYYNNDEEIEFDSWNWLITDDMDTTVSNSDCAYDRIIINQNLNNKIKDIGIDKNVSSEESDHYLIWVEIIP